MEKKLEANFNLIDLNYCKIYIGLINAGKFLLSKICKDLYIRQPESDNGRLSLDKFCRDKYKKSARKEFGKLFPEEYTMISFIELQIDLEISSCFKLIQKCNNIENGSNLLSAIEKLKSFRNELDHKYVRSISSIKTKKNVMNKIFSAICKEAGTLFNEEKKYAGFNKETACIISDTWKNCEVQSIEDKRHEIISKTDKELEEYYTINIKSTDASSLLSEGFTTTFIDHTFVDPVLYHSEKLINSADIPFIGEENSKECPVLISGQFGSGKTTVCHYLISSWCNRISKSNKLRKFDFLFFIDMKKVDRSTVLDYIQDRLLPGSLSVSNDETTLDILKEYNILFILDGYDERNSAGDNLTEDLFKNFGDKKIVFTSRTESIEKLFNILKRKNLHYSHIKLLGFKLQEREKYISNVWDLFEKDGFRCRSQNDFKEFLNEKGKIFGNILNLPLFNVLFIYLWNNQELGKNEIFNFTSLYTEIFDRLTEKLIQKLTASNDTERFSSDFKDIIRTLLNEMSQQCYRLYINKKYLIDNEFKDTLEKLCKNHQIDFPKFISSFLICNGFSYNFFHHSQMEYLVAKHMVNSSNTLEELRNLSKDAISGVIMFIVGLSSVKNINEPFIENIFENIIKIKEHSDKYSILWKILAESRKFNEMSETYTCNKHIVKVANRYLKEPSIWKVCDSNVVSALQLLIETNGKNYMEKLIIDLKKDPYDIPYLEETFLDLKEAFKKVEYTNKKYIELYFEKQFAMLNSKIDRENDSSCFLESLSSWGSVYKFTGSLSDGFQYKTYFKDLKSIDLHFSKLKALKEFSKFLQEVRKVPTRIGIKINLTNDASKFPEIYAYDADITYYFIKIVNEEKLKWVCEVLERLCKKTKCLKIDFGICQFSIDSLEKYKKEIGKHVTKKVSLKLFDPLTEEEEKQLNRNIGYRFNFL